jgi:hypothetical protein
MKCKIAICILLTLVCISCNKVEISDIKEGAEQVSLVDYVNPLMGTDSIPTRP